MKFKIIDSISESSNGIWNEDAILLSEDIFAVLDGATAINQGSFKSYNTFAEWFVQSFVTEFIRNESKKTFPEKMVDVIKLLSNDQEVQNLNISDIPCFVFGAVQLMENSIRIFNLGDCSIYIEKMNGETIRYYDDRVDVYAQRTLSLKKDAMAHGDDYHDAIKKQKTINRKSMNVKEGYWTVSLYGDFLSEIIISDIEVSDIRRIFICSDGFDRGMDLFDLFSIDEIMTLKYNLRYYFERIRAYEEKHSEMLDFPCVKKSDDVTGILIERSL